MGPDWYNLLANMKGNVQAQVATLEQGYSEKGEGDMDSRGSGFLLFLFVCLETKDAR